MTDWGLALKIAFFGLTAVFSCLALLTGAIYAFGKILRLLEKKGD